MSGSDAAGARAVLVKLGQLLRELAAAADRNLTCSVGAVEFRERPASTEDAVAVAGRAMHEAKTLGKDTATIRVYARSDVGGAAESIGPSTA